MLYIKYSKKKKREEGKMNSSELMDKQIMDLSNKSHQSITPPNINHFIDHINIMTNNNNSSPPPKKEDEDEIGDNNNNNSNNVNDDDDEIVPSYDFHPIRSLPRHQSRPEFSGANYSSIYSNEPAKNVPEKDHNVDNSALLSEIERTMKSHADNLMHALEGVSARISQLESRSRNLENSVEDLKIAMGNNQGSSDGKMRQLENIMREVQTGVQVIRDKQDILESQLHLTKLQVPKVEHQTEPQPHVHSSSYQPIASAPLQSHHLQPPPSLSPPSLPPAPQQNLPNQYLPNQFPPPPQRDSYYPPSSQPQDTTAPQYPPPTPQYPQLPASPQYSQQPPPQQHPSLSSMNPPQLPLPHHPEDSPYPPPQSYPPNLHQPSPQQFYNSPSNMYEPPSTRLNPGYSPNYGPSSGPTEPPPYPYGGPPSQYGAKQHTQLPTARVLPSGGSSGTGNNRVPIDDVVDKVTNMGFSREQARATVRKLMENGQAVDLNMVLDKLMNEGVESQPPKGFYGR